MEREPDITQDPRDISTGQGYPEQQPEGASPVEGRDRGPESDVGRPSAPETSSPEEGNPGQATGNPGAAGAETGRGQGDPEPGRPG